MRQRGIRRAGRHDRLVAGADGTELAHSRLKLIAHLRLREAVGESRRNLGQCLIGDATCLRHHLDLGGVFDAALGLDNSGRRHQLAGD